MCPAAVDANHCPIACIACFQVGVCHFAMAATAGLLGSALTDAADISHYQEVAQYLTRTGAAAAAETVPASGWFWWAYSNSSQSK